MASDSGGAPQEKRIRAAYEFREYKITPEEQQAYAFDNLKSLVPIAGFQIRYANSPTTITAQKGSSWILIRIAGPTYNISLIRLPDGPKAPAKTAEEISREMRARNRVDIYGIEFSLADQAVQEKQSPILFEILKYLGQESDASIVIESYMVKTKGFPEDDLEITRERANSILDWLLAHGIVRTRLRSMPFGRRENPLNDEPPAEMQRNERIVLAKAGPASKP